MRIMRYYTVAHNVTDSCNVTFVRARLQLLAMLLKILHLLTILQLLAMFTAAHNETVAHNMLQGCNVSLIFRFEMKHVVR